MQANQNILPSSQAAVAAVINPDAHVAGTVTSGWVHMKNFEAIQALVQLGQLGASATVDAKLEQATDGSGTGAKDIVGKSITQLSDAGADAGKLAVINCRAVELDIVNNFTHVRLSLTIGTATSDAGGLVLGHYPHYGPASDHDYVGVKEIIE